MNNCFFLRPLSRFVSETIQYMAIDTMEDEHELVRDVSKGAISKNLE